MGFFDSSSSTSIDKKQDKSINDGSTSEGNFAFEAGNFTLGGYDNNNTIQVHNTELDGGAIAGAFEYSGDVSERAFDFADNLSDDAFDFAGDTYNRTTSTLAGAINNVLSFASKSQQDASEQAQIITAQQSKGFTDSLRSLNSAVSSTLTQGSTDIIKYLVMGAVAFGVVFAIKGK